MTTKSDPNYQLIDATDEIIEITDSDDNSVSYEEIDLFDNDNNNKNDKNDKNNNDLYKKHDQLIKLKKETYEKLYNRCMSNIKLTSNAGELICFFEIPPFLFGSSYPIINIESCANYIMNKLTTTNSNIKTSFIEPNIIFIDWRREKDMVYASYDNRATKSNKSTRSTRSTGSNRLSNTQSSPRYTSHKRSNEIWQM